MDLEREKQGLISPSLWLCLVVPFSTYQRQEVKPSRMVTDLRSHFMSMGRDSNAGLFSSPSITVLVLGASGLGLRECPTVATHWNSKGGGRVRPGWASSLPRAWNNSKGVLRLGREGGDQVGQGLDNESRGLGLHPQGRGGLGNVFSSRAIVIFGKIPLAA